MLETRREVLAVLGIAFLSLFLCGIVFPLAVLAISQLTMPFQANGELVSQNGKIVGSYLIAQEFKNPAFFHPRNGSASGFDPHITLQDAYIQAERIHNITGISLSSIREIIDGSIEFGSAISGEQYVNVLSLNLKLIESFPSVYSSYAS
jgi:K+-transporting ATPase ATPase C chain